MPDLPGCVAAGGTRAEVERLIREAIQFHLESMRDLQQPFRRRVMRAIQALARDPRPHGVALLSGPQRIWRVRVGDYRILYRLDDDLVLVVVIRIRHRKPDHPDRSA